IFVRNRFIFPELQMGIEGWGILNLHHLPHIFHGLIPSPLSLRLGPCLFRRMPTWQSTAFFYIAGYLRSHYETDFSLSKFWQCHYSLFTIQLIGHALFPFADGIDALHQVSVPFHGVHRHVQVTINNKHNQGFSSLDCWSCFLIRSAGYWRASSRIWYVNL